MKEFLKLAGRFLFPYKKYIGANIIANILTAFFNLFSFILIIPILNILFKSEAGTQTYQYIPWSFDMNAYGSWNEFIDVMKNNFYWYVTDYTATHGEIASLIVLGVFLVVMTFLKTGNMYFAAFFMIPLRTGVVRDIRNQINDKVVSLPIKFFSSERKGDIMARITGDVGEVENSIMTSMDMMIKNPILIIIYVTGMFIISWQLTLFVMVLLPVSGYIMGGIGKKLKSTSALAQQQWGNLMAQIEETLGGLRIIKAFNAEEKIKNRFRRGNESFRKTSIRIGRRQSLAHPVSELLGTITIVIVLWFGGTLILDNNSAINGATFIYYLVIFYSLINPAKELSKSLYAIQKGLASMERVDKILKAESDIKDPENPKPIHFNGTIEYKDVWFKYQEKWILKNINLSIPKGKTIALVGQSGSGKSTFVDLLPRYYDVDRGAIEIDGLNIKDTTMFDLRRLMGNVNQEAILFNDSFFNNIAFGVENATLEQVIEAAKVANAHDFIMATADQYHTNIGDRGCKLSGGQRQRISIARAILKNPAILILDEATSALDTESERLVQDALENLMKNRTTIVIAHRLSTIKNADEICVMHDGEIVERGRHDELMKLDRFYKRLVDMQSF
ncbi:MAG: ABC transporter ATP-binding protein/permease [Dysgonamonadaceae bacterium]|jgi:ATP-binding cassette subfamily B protein/subfamily B ATP-binding cassette protein MsbA|nr:ABC transporter ATP-binding protein/permease [Dysgonamonadaceae bacterium]